MACLYAFIRARHTVTKAGLEEDRKLVSVVRISLFLVLGYEPNLGYRV